MAKTPGKQKKPIVTKKMPAASWAWYWKELERLYPQSHCALEHRGPFELLIATILSAQCTDVMVNKVTPELFRCWPTPGSLASAPRSEVEKVIRPTGFYRNKARNIQGASAHLAKHHHSQVPDTMDELLELPGVARKTANVVLGNAYGKNVGVVVDTHVGRLSRRMGLTKHTDPVKVELDLMKQFPGANWTMLSHRLIDHGRAVCGAKKPRCDSCTLAVKCPKIDVK